MTKTKEQTKKESENVFGLCAGRHEMPCTEFIFQEVKDPFDFNLLNKTIEEKLKNINSNEKITIYVTGLTVLLTSVLEYCFKNNIKVELKHFNIATQEYVSQDIL